MNQLLVSIIIPVYNGSNYLAEAIDSALAQTYKNTEIIVVNDGSNDDGKTEKIALGYGDKIRYFEKENGGVSTALNLGIENMKGEYFSWLSHDDRYTPEKIEKQIVSLKNANSHNSIAMCQTKFIDKDSLSLNRTYKVIPIKVYTAEEMLYTIFNGYSISGCALLIPKEAFEIVGLFNTKIKYMQDTEMWYRLFLNGFSVVCNKEISVESRVHSLQVTVTGKHLGKIDADIVGSFMVQNLKDRYFVKVNLLKQYMYICMRNQSIKAGNKALKLLKENKQISPFEILKASAIKLYGKLRPTLVKIYYQIRFNIKVKVKKQ